MTVFVFYSIHDVMKAEQVINASGIAIDIIPVPKQISSDCGMAISLKIEDKERLEDLLAACDIAIKGVYRRISSKEWITDYKKS